MKCVISSELLEKYFFAILYYFTAATPIIKLFLGEQVIG